MDKEQTVDDCFWHDPARKDHKNIKDKLEERAKTKIPMDGFVLAREDLSEVNLVNRAAKQGFKLTNSDLYHANMEHAHLFMLDLSGSSLMKANLSYANLHYANLTDCNLLGTDFTGAKIDKAEFGEKISQEKQADASTSIASKIDLYEQAEEIYRNLRQTAEAQGLFEMAGHFFEKEMIMRRKQLPKYSFKRWISKMVELFCGYGERPLRVIAFSMIVIFLFSIGYFFLGVNFSGDIIAYDGDKSLLSNAKNYLSCLYFSVVTFTTLGYGDITPVGGSRVFSAIEAFTGSFTLALFVVVFVKKMTR
ncbi:MAG: ion channel [Gammaproteobacteria bacterium]|nr:ion channel [Gammaproteobacteria bacterium]MDH5630473.1 ion channel [Gammaproteobacteria bacterium]